ncbi:MAG: peptidoglycan endopeptidase [Pseudomonadota bacterium]
MTCGTSEAQIIARTALALVGTPFRLHGRDPNHGLDCIGLCALCVKAAGRNSDIPNGYALRGGDAEKIRHCIRHLGFRDIAHFSDGPDAPWNAGDIVLTRPAPLQLHLLVHTELGMVHAHAGLRRVVCTPGRLEGRILSTFRILES